MTVKAAALAAGLAHADSLFPEYFKAPDIDAQERAIGEDAVYDYSDVDWKMPSQEDPEETLRLLKSMGANLAMTVSDDEEFVPEPPPGLANLPTEADREWL